MTFDEIIEYMLTSVPSEYDISVGSFFYDLLYPVAEQVYRLQGKISDLDLNAFALTAVGEYLDRKVAEQGIKRKQATFATGTVRIRGDVGATIQKGSKVAADEILLAVDKTAVIPNNGYIDLPATCVTAGAVGNVGIGDICYFPVTLPKLTEVTNITEFTGGYDEESDSELLERYLERVSRPNVSGNKYHYIEWAKEVSGVGDASVIPLWNGPGTVKVVIVDSLNQPADDDLITAVSEHIETLRPIGAKVTVVSASELTVNVSVNVSNTITDEMTESISDAIKNYLSNEALAKGYISYAKIGSIILAVDGVEDYSSLKVNNGTANITIADGAVPVLGSVGVT